MKSAIEQPQVLPLQKRLFSQRKAAISYFEQFTGYSYEIAKNEAGIPWNIWSVNEGQNKFFIGTAAEWIEWDLSLN